MRLRSIVSAAGNDPGAVTAAAGLQADAVLLSVADATTPVDEARRAVTAALGVAAQAEVPALVTCNHPRTELLRGDIEAVFSSLVRGVLIPHAVEPQDVRDVAVLLREFELQRGVEPGDTLVFPVIDTARGLLHAEAIAAAAPRVGGLVFHAGRYARDIGVLAEQRGDRLAYARGKVVAVCRGLGQAPLVTSDGVELTYLASCGFAGAILPDGRPAAAANAAFAPMVTEKDYATEAAMAYDAARAAGARVARFGESVIDGDAAAKARRLIGE